MRVKTNDLLDREKLVLDMLWSSEMGLTSVDMLKLEPEKLDNATYVHRTINRLIEKNLIEVCGSERSGKQYARRFKATVTREEFVADKIVENGIKLDDFDDVAMALFKHSSEKSFKDKKKYISKLQEIIDNLNAN